MGVVCIKLDAATMQAARQQLLVIQVFEMELMKKRIELDEIVKQATGIDTSSGNWNLDIDHGLLEGEEVENTENTDVPEQDDLSSRRNAKTRTKGGRGNSVHPTDPSVS